MKQNSSDFNTVLQRWATIYARRSIQDMMKFAHQTNLNMPQISIMMRLHYRGPATINDLRKELYGSRAAATQMIDSLVRAGLVERAEAEEDRRKKLVSLTAAGKNLVEQSMAARHQWIEDLGNSLNPEERALTGQVFQKMIQAALELETRGDEERGGAAEET